MSKIMSRFVQLLAKKELKTGKRYSQKEIADALSVSPSTVSRWMNGQIVEKSSLETVRRICDFLECEVGDLLYIERELA